MEESIKQKLTPGQVGIAGEYAVLSELITNGFAAGRTDGNSKDIDILCSYVQTGKTTNIQVKTLSPDTNDSRKSYQRLKFRVASRKKKGYTLEEKIDAILNKRIYYIFCALKNPDFSGREKDRFFVATPEEVAAQIRERTKKKTNVIDFILYDKAENSKIPEGGFGVVNDYEDKWEKLK